MPSKQSFKFLSISCFLCFFFFLLVDSNLQTEELALLLKLKQYWQDPPLMSHWNNASNTHYCSWPELTCRDGSVTELKLSYTLNRPRYTIPPFICDLKNITSLDLSVNYLQGDFPTALYSCSKLTHLDLNYNSFTGSIPSDIHHMANLQMLNLENNFLTGNLPDSIFALKNLKELCLSNNSLSSEIPEVTTDFNLTIIDLSANNFEGKIPKNICGKGNLVTLDVSNNNLSGELFESLTNCHGWVTLRACLIACIRIS